MPDPRAVPPADVLIAAIDVIESSLETFYTGVGGRKLFATTGVGRSQFREALASLRRHASAARQQDERLGDAFLTRWHEHLDAQDIARDAPTEPTPLLAGELIRAAVQATGATIIPGDTPAEDPVMPETSSAPAAEPAPLARAECDCPFEAPAAVSVDG